MGFALIRIQFQCTFEVYPSIVKLLGSQRKLSERQFCERIIWV